MLKTIIAPDRWELVKALIPKDSLIVEVGVQRGAFSASLLTLDPKMLFLVDAWRVIGGSYGELDPEARKSEEAAESDRRLVVDLFRWQRNVSVLCLLSSEAAELFADESLDAVYLDGDHTAQGITTDLRLWWRKIRDGGILCGHDYCTKPWIQVEEHVNRFVSDWNLPELMLSGEPDYPSWAVRKSWRDGPPR